MLSIGGNALYTFGSPNGGGGGAWFATVHVKRKAVGKSMTQALTRAKRYRGAAPASTSSTASVNLTVHGQGQDIL